MYLRNFNQNPVRHEKERVKCAPAFYCNPKKIFSLTAILAIFFLAIFIFPEGAQATTETFTSSTTWVAPAGVTSVTAEVWGGGGGGGGTIITTRGSVGGGGGAYSKKNTITVVPLSSYTVTVGAGGAGGTNAVGVTGGDSYFCNSTTNCASISGTAVQAGAKGGAGGLYQELHPPEARLDLAWEIQLVLAEMVGGRQI